MKYTQTPVQALGGPGPQADRLHEEVTLLRDRIAQLDAHGNGSGYEKRLHSAYITLLQDRLCELAIHETPAAVPE